MADRSVNIRLQVAGSEAARAKLLALGQGGQEALAKIEAAGPGASTSLGRLDQASGRAGRAARGLGADVAGMARDVATGTVSIESLSTSIALAASRFGLWGTVAAVTVTTGAALWQSMRDLGDETDQASDAADRMAGVQAALRDLTEDSTVAIRDQTIEVSRLGGAARESGLALVELRGDLAELARDKALDTIRSTVDELQSLLLQPTGSEILGRGPILQALAAISEAQASDDPSKLAGSISRLIRQMDDPALVGFAETLAKGSAEAIRLEAEVRAVDAALEDAGSGAARTSKEIEAATRAATKAAEQAARDVEKLAAQRERTADKLLADLKRTAQEIDRESSKLGAADEKQATAARAQLEREADATARLLMQPFETPLCSMRTPFQASAEAILA